MPVERNQSPHVLHQYMVDFWKMHTHPPSSILIYIIPFAFRYIWFIIWKLEGREKQNGTINAMWSYPRLNISLINFCSGGRVILFVTVESEGRTYDLPYMSSYTNKLHRTKMDVRCYDSNGKAFAFELLSTFLAFTQLIWTFRLTIRSILQYSVYSCISLTLFAMLTLGFISIFNWNSSI